MPKATLNDAMRSIAHNLREFGYGDVTWEMIREIYDAWAAGKRFPDLPHGVIGAFAGEQFQEHHELIKTLKDIP